MAKKYSYIINGERKRKLLTDPEKLWAKCAVCQEPGNLEHLIWQKVATKDKNGKWIFGAFKGVYFCSESCQGEFKG